MTEETRQTMCVGTGDGAEAHCRIDLPAEPTQAEYRTAVLLCEHLKKVGVHQGLQITVGTVLAEKAIPQGAHGYAIVRKGNTLEIAANSQYGYGAARRVLFEDFPTADVTCTGDGAGELLTEPARAGALRILTNNIYGGTKGDPHARMEMLAEIYRIYAPDLCAFQEYHDGVRAHITPMLNEMGYREVTYSAKSVNDGNSVNSTPLFYKPDVLDLMDRGYVWYATIDYDNPVYADIRGKYTADEVKNAMAFSSTRWDYSKGFAWGIFREKKTGKVFMAASTHLWWMASRPQDDLCRSVQISYAKEFLLRKADAWLAENLPTAKKGTMPIFYAGDMNMTTARPSYRSLITDTPVRLGDYRNNAFVNTDGLVPAGEGIKASTNHHREGKFNEALGIYTEPYYNQNDPYRNSIDYIFTYRRENGSDPTVTRSCSIYDEYALLATDHCPVFIDCTLGEETAAYPVRSITLGGVDLHEATILTPANDPVDEYRTAVLLAEHLWRLAGIKPAVVKDAEKVKGACRIVVGRELCEKAAPKGAHGFAIAGNGTTLEIAANDQFGYEAAQKALFAELFAGEGDIVLTDETAHSGSGEAFISVPIERRGTLRMMENNVYGGNGGRNPEHACMQQMQMYRAYAPDVIGFQEYHNPNARRCLTPLLNEAGYLEVTFDVPTINDGHSVNSTPVFYNPETVELLDKGYLWYRNIDFGADIYAEMRGRYTGDQIRDAMIHNSAGEYDYSKGLSYGIFRLRSTGDVFLFGSTHLWWMWRNEADDICRQLQLTAAKEFLLNKANAWLAANDPGAASGSMPVFLGGDYNMNKRCRSFAAMHEQTPAAHGMDTRFHNLNDLVPEGRRIPSTTAHGYADYNSTLKILENPKYNEKEPYDRSIDYLFVNHSARPMHVGAMRRIADLYAYLSSDHCPIFADVSFGHEAGGEATKEVCIGGVSLADTVIVIPQNSTVSEYRTAMLLYEHLKNHCGPELSVVEDNGAVRGAAQIRIGATLCQKAKVDREHGYAVAGNGNTLEIVAADAYGYEAVQAVLANELFAGDGVATTDETHFVGDGKQFVTAPIAHAGDVRMMFHNIWGASSREHMIHRRRMQHIAEIYETYHPDIIGCEEYHESCRALLQPMILSLGYKEVDFGHSINDGTSYNSTPLFYDPTTVELLDKGYFWYRNLNYGHPAYARLRGPYSAEDMLTCQEVQRSGKPVRYDYSKGLTWGIFRVKKTGTVFLAASTHLWWKNTPPVDGVACSHDHCRGIQVAYAKELLLTRSNLWLQKNDPSAAPGSMPIFLGGDYNMASHFPSFATLAAQTPSVMEKLDADGNVLNADDPLVAADRRYRNLNDLAPEGERITFKTHHGYAGFDKELGIHVDLKYSEKNPYAGSIDYIFANETATPFTVERMACVHDTNAYSSSDHNPIFADITFGKNK